MVGQIRSDHLSSTERAKVVCYKSFLDKRLFNHTTRIPSKKPYGLLPTACSWPHWEGITFLQRCNRDILMPQLTGWCRSSTKFRFRQNKQKEKKGNIGLSNRECIKHNGSTFALHTEILERGSLHIRVYMIIKRKRCIIL